MADLMSLACDLSQRMLGSQLIYKNVLEAMVLEVKAIHGLGELIMVVIMVIVIMVVIEYSDFVKIFYSTIYNPNYNHLKIVILQLYQLNYL